jgi:8-oxo-dGTP pyrophosphatase MutT (NUDIX family)
MRLEEFSIDMSKLIFGERIGRNATLRPGSSAIIFDTVREKILLTRRSDNGRWCLPGGGMDAGESASEACVREVLEETGLAVRVTRIVGVYTSPDLIIEYPDGNRVQPVAFSFEAEVFGGELGLSEETTDYGYFTMQEMDALDLMEHHKERIEDATHKYVAAVFK